MYRRGLIHFNDLQRECGTLKVLTRTNLLRVDYDGFIE